MDSSKIPFIDSETSGKIDSELMQKYQYSIDQLMEIAGLSVAQIIAKKIIPENKIKEYKALVIVGPGNNGGDGLVAARYLKEFGIGQIEIYYPKRSSKELFTRLTTQNEAYDIKFVGEEVLQKLSEYDLIIDAIFGFSFKGNIREPFSKIIPELSKVQEKIVSVDIPSGWDVDKGNINNLFEPGYLISLTLPKNGSKGFKGKHYLGGRFVPNKLFESFGIKLEGSMYGDSIE
ncbi:MAG: NAD(P)H-hydrate epimerase, partial [archaeon]|nr:NAD(P)H-hydrate epimerase [archaeon]